MQKARVIDLSLRRSPQQRRSVATVRAIHEATIQVVLRHGPDRLTTVQVAKRAGVSVGTLYQYFPNKQALLLAVLEEHMEQAAKAVETVCVSHRLEPLDSMLDALVHAYVQAKVADQDTAVALFAIFSQLAGQSTVRLVRGRCLAAIAQLLQTAQLPPSADTRYMARIIHTALSGAVHAYLESEQPRSTKKLTEHLVRLTLGYCRAA